MSSTRRPFTGDRRGERRTQLRESAKSPRADQERAKAALAELIDAVSNKDDEIAGLVLEEKPITAPVLKAAIRRLTCKIELVPVLSVRRSRRKPCRFGGRGR